MIFPAGIANQSQPSCSQSQSEPTPCSQSQSEPTPCWYSWSQVAIWHAAGDPYGMRSIPSPYLWGTIKIKPMYIGALIAMPVCSIYCMTKRSPNSNQSDVISSISIGSLCGPQGPLSHHITNMENWYLLCVQFFCGGEWGILSVCLSEGRSLMTWLVTVLWDYTYVVFLRLLVGGQSTLAICLRITRREFGYS